MENIDLRIAALFAIPAEVFALFGAIVLNLLRVITLQFNTACLERNMKLPLSNLWLRFCLQFFPYSNSTAGTMKFLKERNLFNLAAALACSIVGRKLLKKVNMHSVQLTGGIMILMFTRVLVTGNI